MTEKLDIFSRCTAAVIGGYGCCIASSFALIPIFNYGLLMAQDDSVYLAAMVCYLFYVGAIISCFCTKTATVAWRNMIVFSSGCGLLFLLFDYSLEPL